MNRDSRSALDHGHARQGLALGISAYGLWGVLPIYFKALRSIDAFNIVAHRIVWSVPILAALLSFTGTWGEVREALRNRKAVILLTITSSARFIRLPPALRHSTADYAIVRSVRVHTSRCHR